MKKRRIFTFALYPLIKNPVAAKAFSPTVLANLAKLYPEISPEIKLLVQEQLPHQSAAF